MIVAVKIHEEGETGPYKWRLWALAQASVIQECIYCPGPICQAWNERGTNSILLGRSHLPVETGCDTPVVPANWKKVCLPWQCAQVGNTFDLSALCMGLLKPIGSIQHGPCHSDWILSVSVAIPIESLEIRSYDQVQSALDRTNRGFWGRGN